MAGWLSSLHPWVAPNARSGQLLTVPGGPKTPALGLSIPGLVPASLPSLAVALCASGLTRRAYKSCELSDIPLRLDLNELKSSKGQDPGDRVHG